MTLAEKLNEPFDLASVYISCAYDLARDSSDVALEYAQKAFRIGVENGFVPIVQSALDVYSLHEEVKGNIPGAIKYLEQALEFLKEKQRPDLELNVYNNLLYMYTTYMKNNEKREELGLRGLTIADSLKSKLYSLQFHKELHNVYADRGMYQKAYIHLEELVTLRAKVMDEQSQKQINYLTARFDADRREMKIKEMEIREKVRKVQIAAGLVVSVVILALLWYLLRLRNRRNHALTERNEALVEINATKDKFFSIISHDIKNPAIAQRDALKRLVKNASVWDAATLANYYDSLLESAEGEVELVYNLLGWAQIQTGRMVYTPSTFNLASGLRSDISLIRNMADKKGISLDVRIPEDADVTGDSNMLATAVRNLLSNAVKFTPADGTVTLDISLCDKEVCPLAYTISITDTGIGMTEEQINSLFRLDSARSRRGTAGEQGSGLGLIVCKELLEKHGSVLHVESAPGSGSRFWFTISA